MLNTFPVTSYTPHAFQHRAIETIIRWDEQYTPDEFPNATANRFTLASPTGTGKSIIELKLMERWFPESWLVTPRVEIIKDLLTKLGVKYNTSKSKSSAASHIAKIAFKYNITTPLRFRNGLLNGDIGVAPKKLLFDEGHHESADTYQDIETMMPEDCKFIPITATPYRGTPRSTAAFYARNGKPFWAITYPEAMQQKYLAMPICETVGLVDDDMIELTSTGEFIINRLTAAVKTQIEHAIELSIARNFWNQDGTPRRATLIGVPSSECMPTLVAECMARGLQVTCITDETPFDDRQTAFRDCMDCKLAIVHINVVGEGVDLPIRQYLDLAPCMSPVQFIQRFGRDTRPILDGEEPPYYLCTNRNIERHGYLLDGCLPVHALSQAQRAFEKPSERIRVRCFGLESLGKLQGYQMKLTNGVTVLAYSVSIMRESVGEQYTVLCHPQYAYPLWWNKKFKYNNDGQGNITRDYGTWERVKPPAENLAGFSSSKPTALTPKQAEIWYKDARKYGLEPDQKIDAKRIQLFFCLKNSRASLVEQSK